MSITEMINLRIVAAAFIMIAALIFLQYRLWFAANGINDSLRLKQMLVMQKIENNKLKQRNDALASELERIMLNHDAVEARARNELGMIKKDEMFYRIVP